MNALPDTLAAPYPAADPVGADARRVERQLDMLEQLAGMGMDIAGAVRDRALAAEATVDTDRETGLAFARVSHAIRQTILLQDRLRHDQRGREDLAERAAARRQDDAAETARDHIDRIVARVAVDSHGEGDHADRLREEAAERLEQDDLYGGVLARPISEIVADICHDMGLQPDWPTLAQEAWARAEIAGGDVGWPLAEVLDAAGVERSVTSPAHRAAGGEPLAREPMVEGAGRYDNPYLSSA
jgi:hypothetical protein